jgi:hypothetical protein
VIEQAAFWGSANKGINLGMDPLVSIFLVSMSFIILHYIIPVKGMPAPPVKSVFAIALINALPLIAIFCLPLTSYIVVAIAAMSGFGLTTAYHDFLNKQYLGIPRLLAKRLSPEALEIIAERVRKIARDRSYGPIENITVKHDFNDPEGRYVSISVKAGSWHIATVEYGLDIDISGRYRVVITDQSTMTPYERGGLQRLLQAHIFDLLQIDKVVYKDTRPRGRSFARSLCNAKYGGRLLSKISAVKRSSGEIDLICDADLGGAKDIIRYANVIPAPDGLKPFAIGMPKGRSDAETNARKAAIMKALDSKCEITVCKDSAEFAASKQPGIYIDSTIPDAYMLEAVALAMSRINSGQTEIIARLIEKIIGPIENLKPAEIFALAQKKLADNTPSVTMLSELKGSVETQHEALVTYLNKNAEELDAAIARLNPGVKREAPAQEEIVISAVTDTVAVEDPAFRESVARNRANNIKTPLIFGSIFPTVKEAEAFVMTSGIDIKDIEFVDGRDSRGKMLKHDDLISTIQEKFAGVKEQYIGIRAAEEEMGSQDKATKGRLLLVRRAIVGGRNVLLAMNSEKVLLNLIFTGSNAGELRVPGLSYDETRKVFFFAPIVPIDYGREIEVYRNAILLLSSAA